MAKLKKKSLVGFIHPSDFGQELEWTHPRLINIIPKIKIASISRVGRNNYIKVRITIQQIK